MNEMNKKVLRGIIPALVTPINEDESFNAQGMAEIIENALSRGVGGFLALGTSGEPTAWSFEERGVIVDTVIKQVNNRVPVIVGCGAPSTRETVRLCQMAQDKGADYLAVVTPYFITPTEEDLYIHYCEVARHTDLPVLIYNIPQRTGICLSAALVEKLKSVPNIVGIKDSSGNFELFKEFMKLNDDKFQVIQGIDKFFLNSFKLGATAAISGPSNSIPGNQTAIFENCVNGEIAEAQKYQDRFMHLKEVIDLAPGPTIAKEAANIVGLHAGPPAAPLRRPEGYVHEKLIQVMNEYFSEYFVN
jgi:4-hydroxy-tetrahydrodipicolinate synthase